MLLLGTVGGTAALIDIKNEKRQTAICKSKYSDGANEYLQQYLKWSKLPAEDRLETQWGQDQYGGSQIRKQLAKHQPGRLKADMQELVRGINPPAILAEVLYGKGWKEKVEQYKRRTKIRSEIAIASTMSFLTGMIVFAGFGGNWTIKKFANTSKGQLTEITEQPEQNVSHQEQSQELQDTRESTDIVSDIISAGDTEEEPEEKTEDKTSSIGTKEESTGYFQNPGLSQIKNETLEFKETLRSQATTLENPDTQNQPLQTESKISTLMSTAPGTSDLSDLTQEVSAIRQFAADQQDRVRQLQDGYDWSIIKRFCLRVIRCVDNIDDRIDKLADEQHDTQHLEDVRDELVFSLESSGVEQYQPDINSSYKGLEKKAEAVKGRVHTDDENLVGTIAEIVKPGYQYVVSDDDYKIVRCSQVKLYGKTS